MKDRRTFVAYLTGRYPMMTEREADGLCTVTEHLDALLSIPDAAAGLQAWFRVQAATAFKRALAGQSEHCYGEARALDEMVLRLQALVREVREHEKRFLAPPPAPPDYAAMIHEETR